MRYSYMQNKNKTIKKTKGLVATIFLDYIYDNKY